MMKMIGDWLMWRKCGGYTDPQTPSETVREFLLKEKKFISSVLYLYDNCPDYFKEDKSVFSVKSTIGIISTHDLILNGHRILTISESTTGFSAQVVSLLSQELLIEIYDFFINEAKKARELSDLKIERRRKEVNSIVEDWLESR